VGRLVIIWLLGLVSFAVAIDCVTTVGDAVSNPTLDVWLGATYTALKACVVVAFAVLVAKRGPARRRIRRPVAYLACAAAIVSVSALERPDGATAAAVVLAGEAMALVSVGWMLMSTLALGRCFGVLPEARGLVTGGPYRLVRHPLYLGELGACAGLAAGAPYVRNFVAAIVFVLAQAVRMRMEEQELTHQFPEYAAYAERTPRLIPSPPPLRPRRRLSGVPVSQGESA
jgi:protein-S-isoprenylcysteine O-methyltransferase Ste14